MMTRRDYELIAFSISQVHTSVLDKFTPGDPRLVEAEDALMSAATNIAKNLKQRYPNFNRERFMQACRAD